MFGKSAQEQLIDDLRAEIRALRGRLEKVETATEPFRIGEPRYFICYPGCSDPRPMVTHEQAIRLLMEHEGVEFEKILGTPERVVLKKKAKKS